MVESKKKRKYRASTMPRPLIPPRYRKIEMRRKVLVSKKADGGCSLGRVTSSLSGSSATADEAMSEGLLNGVLGNIIAFMELLNYGYHWRVSHLALD